MNKHLQQTLTINGNDITSEVDDHALLKAKYGQRRDGLLSVEYRFAAWQADVDVNGDKVSFDAANPEADQNDSPLAVVLDGYREVAKRPFTLIVDDNGLVTDLRGWDDILDAFDDKSRALHKGMFDAKYLRENWTAALQRLPQEAVSPGDTWTRSVEHRFHGGQSMTFTTQYKYVGPIEKEGLAYEKIEMTTTDVSYNAQADDASPLVVSDSDLKVIASIGELLFDPQRKQVASLTDTTHIQGDLTFKVTANDKELPGKLDLTIKTEQILLP